MKDFYLTRDLGTSAYLLAEPTIRFEGLESDFDGSKFFKFSPRIKAEKLANEFFSGKALVNARAYSDSIRRAKTLLFQSERG